MTERLRLETAQAFYAGSPLLLVAEKLAAKGEAGEGQRCAEAGVENGDERIRRKMHDADGDAACHHHGHDGEGAGVEKSPEKLTLFGKIMDAAGVFADKAAEHAPKKHEDDDGTGGCQKREMTAVSDDADAHDVNAGGEPNERCQKQ